jgi:hypothetical protein
MNKSQILAKIARNAKQIGLTVNSESATAVVIENGSNDLTISCIDASIQSPMGGVDGSVSPFLGMGVAAPGKIKIKGASGSTYAATIDTLIAAKVLSLCTRFGNNVVIESSDAAFSGEIAGHPDLVGMGQ